jgi:streptogramin lyase
MMPWIWLRPLPLLIAVAVVSVTTGDAAITPIATTVVVASFPLALTEAPAILVAASDAHVWVVANNNQEFIRVDELTGEHSSYAYANGGASVFAAAEGPDGSLWYVDGLNNTVVWKIGSDGRYSSTAVFERTHTLPGSLAGDERGGVWFTQSQAPSIARIDSGGGLVTVSVPTEYRLPGLLVRDSAGVLWFTTEDGVAWRDRRGHFGGVKAPHPSYVTSCSDGSAAYLSVATESYAHADDYLIGWVTKAGVHRQVRRWPLPAPPKPKPLRIGPVSCGLCGGAYSGRLKAPRIVLLGCTISTAWVRVGDTIERLQNDGRVADVRIDALGSVPAMANLVSPRVWLYDANAQRLMELALR